MGCTAQAVRDETGGRDEKEGIVAYLAPLATGPGAGRKRTHIRELFFRAAVERA